MTTCLNVLMPVDIWDLTSWLPSDAVPSLAMNSCKPEAETTFVKFFQKVLWIPTKQNVTLTFGRIVRLFQIGAFQQVGDKILRIHSGDFHATRDAAAVVRRVGVLFSPVVGGLGAVQRSRVAVGLDAARTWIPGQIIIYELWNQCC